MCNRNKTKHSKKHSYSPSLSLNLISISILYWDSDDCWLVKIVLSCKKFVRISPYLHMVYAECKYATGLSHRSISLFYFILFYSVRLFIYLLCTVLKAQIKESPRPIRICHRCGQSRLHGGPQWGRAGFYCPSILLHSIVCLSGHGIYFWWYFNNLIMPKSCAFSMWIRFISPDFNRSVRIRWHMQLSTFQFGKSFGVKWHKYDSCLSCKCQATQLLPKVRQQLPN